jgi:hypothetical protein
VKEPLIEQRRDEELRAARDAQLVLERRLERCDCVFFRKCLCVFLNLLL